MRKHAGARSVDASLAYEPDALVLTVHDDGRGFDAAAPRDGYGIDGMRARVREAGGAFALTTAPGDGTLLTVRLPAPIEEVP
ncbi:sensor histidine kinase [Leifsonia sp. NPDC014704]|uniref:sensor histidine kinase n=1 Tax=Leifsonia sp. NPDC014704 TaxID=3364123 RepID=UPI0036F47EEB